MKTNIQNLLENVVKMHPGKAKIMEIDPETEKRAWQAYKDAQKRITPLLRELRAENARAQERARDTVIGYP